jgi:hypothetical protein
MPHVLGLLAPIVLLIQTSSALFESDLWPGEGYPTFRTAANVVVVREEPSTSARVVQRLRVPRGRQIEFDETRYRTIDVGRLLVLSDTRLGGRVFGRLERVSWDTYYHGRIPREAVTCKRGDVIEYLQDRAEGSCFVRVGDQVIEAESCPAADRRTVQVLAEPKIEWWIRVVWNRAPVGWALVDGKTIQQRGRSY